MGRSMEKRTVRWIAWFLFTVVLTACAAATPAPTATVPLPTATPVCDADGTLGYDKLPQAVQGFDISFQYYLPPCYASRTADSYPVLYLITLTFETRLSATDNTPLSLANRLIRTGAMSPAILIVPSTQIGYGSDAALTEGLVPYINGKFRTLPDRTQRSVGGISHGAAIAARMAFQFPETFGSLMVLSGGITSSEESRFDTWIQRVPSDEWPRVLINVGDRDAIVSLTQNLLDVLKRNEVPYTLDIGHGGHDWTYWSTRMQPVLLWATEATNGPQK